MRPEVLSDADAVARPSTILFLAANPVNSQRIRLDEECREIEKKISASRFGGRLRFRSRWAARPDDLLVGLLEDEPSALHFSGHGAGDEGLCFQADDGNSIGVTAGMLSEVMCAAEGSVKVVVLNACHSEVQARAVITHIPCVIGMPQGIKDSAAIAYSAAFYRALSFALSVAIAHQHGLAALAMTEDDSAIRDIEEASAALRRPTPVLLTRPGVDAKLVYLIEDASCRAEVLVGTRASRVHLELDIDRDFDRFDVDALAGLISELRRLIGSSPVKIICVTRGSVKIVASLPPAAAALLVELRNKGQLAQVNGLSVSGVVEVARIDEYWGATKIARDGDSFFVDTSMMTDGSYVTGKRLRLLSVTDSELLTAWRGGDGACAEELLERYYTNVTNFFLGNARHDVDLLQETFVRCIEEREHIPDGQEFRIYLFGVACNVLLGYLRQRKFRDQQLDINEQSTQAIDPGLSTSVELREEVRRFIKALCSLDFENQVVLKLQFLGNFTNQEIASVLSYVEPGLVSGNIDHLLRRAMDRLDEELSRQVENLPEVVPKVDLDSLAKAIRGQLYRRR